MSAVRTRVLEGPNIHELFDALKARSVYLADGPTLTFRVSDRDGRVTGYAEPVLQATIHGLKHLPGDRLDTIRVTAELSLYLVGGSHTWQVIDGLYTHSPASSRQGDFYLERIN